MSDNDETKTNSRTSSAKTISKFDVEPKKNETVNFSRSSSLELSAKDPLRAFSGLLHVEVRMKWGA